MVLYTAEDELCVLPVLLCKNLTFELDLRRGVLHGGIRGPILDAAEAHTMGESSALDIAWSLEVQEIDAEFRVNRNHVATAMADRAPSDRGDA